jgi:aminomethyltransferase
MGQIFVEGPSALDFLQTLCTNDVSKCGPDQALYSHICNDKGGVIDDIFIYRLEQDKFLVIVNASRSDVDIAWMKKHAAKFSVQVMDVPFSAGLALQGPAAVEIVKKLSPEAAELPRFGIGEFEIGEVSALIARTGYTGEDGFEFFGPAGHLLIIFEDILRHGKQFGLLPCGLGARDTLRTEVAYPLYGHELDENHTPFEAGLSWVVKLEKGDFIGRNALVKQKSEGLKTHLVGFKVESGGVARPEAKVFIAGIEMGSVTSGTFAPSLGFPIGLAFVPVTVPKIGAKLTVKQGERELSAVTIKFPFYAKPITVRK